MSIERIGLQQFVDRLGAALLPDNALIVSSSFHSNFLSKWQTTYPAAWVMGQRMVKADDGRGFTGGVYRQRMRVFVTVRVVVQRHIEGVLTNEVGLTALSDLVNTCLLNWKPVGAREPLVFESGQDGPVFESVITTDLVYSTSATFAQ